jgi:ABC-type histidine transport system ATPase subunit
MEQSKREERPCSNRYQYQTPTNLLKISSLAHDPLHKTAVEMSGSQRAISVLTEHRASNHIIWSFSELNKSTYLLRSSNFLNQQHQMRILMYTNEEEVKKQKNATNFVASRLATDI